MMFWNLAILKSLRQALMAWGVTSLLPCLCLSIEAEEKRSSSSREVRKWVKLLKWNNRFVFISIHGEILPDVIMYFPFCLFYPGGFVQKYSYQAGTSRTCGRKVGNPIVTVRYRSARQTGNRRIRTLICRK